MIILMASFELKICRLLSKRTRAFVFSRTMFEARKHRIGNTYDVSNRSV